MVLSINKSELLSYTLRQIHTLFPDGEDYNDANLHFSLNEALERIEYCFSKVDNKYFCNSQNVVFNHLHGDQYSMFLYFLSNTLYRKEFNTTLCNKLFLLNKALFAVDAYYEVVLPDIFLFVHPLGTVLGRAQYSDYMIVYQRCNIGSNHDIYPTLGTHLSLYPGSSILGKCTVGNNVKIAANALLMDKDIKDNTLYIGTPKEFQLSEKKELHSIWKI